MDIVRREFRELGKKSFPFPPNFSLLLREGEFLKQGEKGWKRGQEFLEQGEIKFEWRRGVSGATREKCKRGRNPGIKREGIEILGISGEGG